MNKVYERLYTLYPRYPQHAVRRGKYSAVSTESDHGIPTKYGEADGKCRVSDS
jgi:hypothetical protein